MRNVTYNWHDPATGYIEAALSRGDRKIGAVIEQVWRDGGHLDAWSDYFSFERWMDAFEKCGLDADFYAARERGRGELLPWEVVDSGVRREHLWRERERCYASELSPDCRAQCTGCGANALIGGVCNG